ncbi:MAG: ABC transporter ATP-binding protein [Pseudomonadota bacterium]
MATSLDKKGQAEPPLLSIRNLTIRGDTDDGPITIVDGVSIHVHRGEVLGLIGESGAGKSTLGLAALGYFRAGCRPDGGQILFDGTDLLGLSDAKRSALRGARLAYVAQSAAASFNPAHRLTAQVTEVERVVLGKSNGDAGERAVEMYGRLQLPDPAHIGARFPHQVSGGQLQRAMTAMAMAPSPDLIVFDEPTTALDVTTQIDVLAAMRRATRELGAAAIYITHDLAVVAQMADRIHVLRYGKTVEEAPTAQMLSSPQADYTKTLWAVRQHQRPVQAAPNAAAPPAAALEGVTAAYGNNTVLHDVSIQLHRGQTVAVVGESGSGKSTAARVFTGLLPPVGGRVTLGGQGVAPRFTDRPRDQLRTLQMVYQSADTALNPRLSVREIVGRPAAFYGGLSGAALEKRVRGLLEMIELDPDIFIDRRPPALSGGQKQRIGLARAIAAEPVVLICDEVTSALDQIVADEILKLIDRLQHELDLAVMFITHDLATVRAVADHVVVMQHGRVVEQGAKGAVLTPPHEPYTETLLASVPEMDPEWLTRVLAERQA